MPAKRIAVKKGAESSAKKQRSSQRVDDTEGRSPGGMNRTAAHRTGGPRDVVPDGMIEICAQVSELVPVAQYANVTIGPVYARRLIVDPGLDKLAGDPKEWDDEQNAIADEFQGHVRNMQDLLEEIVAEDRENVLESVREVNKRKDDEDDSKKK